MPITSGYRYSALGYTDIPEVAAFSKDPLFEIFSSKKDANGGFKLTEAALKDLFQGWWAEQMIDERLVIAAIIKHNDYANKAT